MSNNAMKIKDMEEEPEKNSMDYLQLAAKLSNQGVGEVTIQLETKSGEKVTVGAVVDYSVTEE